ncbi:MAG: hypothetical protein ACREMH_05010, partial [Gemmatimonadales bacterium]
MYRIRLTDGRELEYPSIQEFSAAVREGTVDADASIYHRRAERWLPVREHPHFIRAREEASQAPSPAQGVDLDAIFSLLESPGGRKSPSPAASAPSAPRHVASTPEPKADEPVPTKPTVGAVGDLQVLRTGFEPDESTAPEASQAQADAAKESEQLEEPEALRESTIPIEDLTPPPDPAPPPPTPATRAGFLPAIPSAAEASPASPPVPAASAPEEPKSTADAKPSGRSDDLPWLAAPEPSKKAPWFFGNEASIRPAPATPVEPAIPSSPITLGSSYTEATDESGRELADESGLDPADIPSPELVAATAPAVPADVPDLDWPSKVDDIAEPVGLRSARSWLPVAAGVVAILVIIAVVMIRKASSGSVEREGLQVAVETASATPAPAVRRSEETAALVTPPTVPVGSPSPAPIEATPVPADTAGADAIAPRVRAVPNRIKINPGTIALAPVNLSAGGGIRSHADLMRFYDGSYNAAQAGLEADLVRSGFSRLFGAGTLTTSAGLAQGRRSLSAGRSAMGNYRLRQTAIERAYHDSLKAAGRRLGMSPGELSAWAPRPSRKEPEAAASLAEPLLDRTDEVLELLQREIGHYRLQGNTLVFENRAAADRYAALRSQIGLGLAGLDQAHLTLRAVGRALGSPRLPLEV